MMASLCGFIPDGVNIGIQYPAVYCANFKV
jgi:hypothetical protein